MKKDARLDTVRFFILILIFTISKCSINKAMGTDEPIVVTIKEDGTLNPPSAPMVNEGGIYRITGEIYGRLVIEKNDIIIDGANQLLRGTGVESYIGIMIKNMENITIKNLEIMQYGYGVVISRSIHITIHGFNMHDNSFNGLEIWGTNESIVYNNKIYKNQHGIDLSEYSSKNQIYENNIESNEYGIFIGFSSDNTIYHNNFVDNANHVYTLASTNTWDQGYPDGGNYWSLIFTEDSRSGPNQDQSNSDGISDEPFFIDESNADKYPLIEIYKSSPSETTKSKLIMSVISESSEPLSEAQVVSDFQPDGQPMISGLTDSEGSISFLSIRQGTYNLKISKEGFISEVVIVKLDEAVKAITVTLIHEKASLKFIIKSEDSRLLENVKVSSIIQPVEQTPLTGNTDSSGTITFSDIKKGNYQFTFSKQYYVTTTKEYDFQEDDEIVVTLKIDESPPPGIPGFPSIAIIIVVVLYMAMYARGASQTTR